MNAGIKKYIIARTVITIVIAGLALALVGLVNAPTSAAPADAPGGAPQNTVTSFARYTLLTANNVTETKTGTGVRIANFESIDCFGVIDAYLPQTVTLSYQASADGTNYATVASMTAATTDTTNFTRTLVYGEYYRVYAALGGSNNVTVTVKCVAKN